MTNNAEIFPEEAQVLSRYLVGEKCLPEIESRYKDAISKLQVNLNDRQKQTWQRMLLLRFYMKLIDSGLAVAEPDSLLRQRIFIMLCLLETSPAYTEYFLDRERNAFYLVQLFLKMTLSGFFLIAGTIIVKFQELNKRFGTR